eukprot:1039203-Pleurochrysis_carterae.AAC.2
MAADAHGTHLMLSCTPHSAGRRDRGQSDQSRGRKANSQIIDDLTKSCVTLKHDDENVILR